MANRPFTAENTDIFTEAIYTSAPATFGTNNVIVTQALNRSIFDQNSTSIAGNPQVNIPSGCAGVCPCGSFTPQVQTIPAQREYIPGGVSFTFNPLAQNYALQGFSSMDSCCSPRQCYQGNLFNPCFSQPQHMPQQLQQPLTLEQQIAVKQLERENLEFLLLHEHLKRNPCKVQFHYNGQTSTTDLLQAQSQVPRSHGMADFKNISGTMMDLKNEIEEIGGTDKLPPDSPPTALYSPVSKAKKLILTKSPDIQKQSSFDKDKNELFFDTKLCSDSQMQAAQQAEQQGRTSDQAIQTKKVIIKNQSNRKSKKRKSHSSSEELVSDESSSSSTSSEVSSETDY